MAIPFQRRHLSQAYQHFDAPQEKEYLQLDAIFSSMQPRAKIIHIHIPKTCLKIYLINVHDVYICLPTTVVSNFRV